MLCGRVEALLPDGSRTRPGHPTDTVTKDRDCCTDGAALSPRRVAGPREQRLRRGQWHRDAAEASGAGNGGTHRPTRRRGASARAFPGAADRSQRQQSGCNGLGPAPGPRVRYGAVSGPAGRYDSRFTGGFSPPAPAAARSDRGPGAAVRPCREHRRGAGPGHPHGAASAGTGDTENR